MFITAELIFINPELSEKKNIKITQLKYMQKCECN